MQSRQDKDTRSRPTSTSVDRPAESQRRHWLEPRSRWSELLDRLPYGFWAPPGSPTSNWIRRGESLAWTPEIEIYQRGDEFVVRADLPGIEKKDVTVEVQDDALVIHGERSNQHEEEREGYYSSERTYGHFYRVVPLPEGAITDSVKASFRNGVLEVVTKAPPHDTNRGRRIEISDTAR